METVETGKTQGQLRTAIIQCGEQEQQVELFQLTLTDYPADWQQRATLWCQHAIPQLQENAVILDGLLEQADEGKAVNISEIPLTPITYTRLLVLEKNKEKLTDIKIDMVELFRTAVFTGNVELVDLLLQDPRVDPSADNNWAIRFASNNGHLSIVDRLLQDPRVDPSANDNAAIQFASYNGHLIVVDRLLQDPRVDPSANDNGAILFASDKGHLVIVDRLLQDPRVDPSADYNCAIKLASKKGHLAVVNRLLQDSRVDPSADIYAVKWALEFGHLAVVNRLLQDPRVKPL
jgi:hypothetical protein